MIHMPIFLLAPNNFAHKAGDGVKTRKHTIKHIHPALQANTGGSQCTYLLELWNLSKVGKDMDKIICERRMDEGLRMFKDDVCGTIRTIDAGGV